MAGEVYVRPVSDDPTRFAAGSTLLHEDGRVLQIESSRPHRDRLLVRFEGADDRSSAERLRGALYVAANEVRELPSDEHWANDIVGCEVVTAAGAPVGRVERLIHGPAQDLLDVTTEAGDRLIPMVAAIVLEVDTAQRRIVVDPPEGLL